VSTDETGGIKPKAGTTDNTALLTFPMINGFPRWNPNVAPAAPVGYLGDFAQAHKITGGTYVPAGANGVDNAFTIKDPANNVIARTEDFFVSGKLAGPLQANTYAVDFLHSNVGAQTPNKTVTLTNVGAPTTVSARAITGLNTGDYLITGGTCAVGTALATDQSCTVTVAFRPTAVGTRTAQLRVTPASGPDLVATLTGIGDVVGTPAVTMTPGTLPFGTRNAGTNTALPTTIRNSGTAPLVVSTTTITGAQAADFTIVAALATPCPATRPFTLAVGASCNLAVNFSPKGSGARAGTLAIGTNATPSTTNVSLSGTGVVSTFNMSPSPIKFGTTNRGTTARSTISIKNSGTIAFTVGAATFTGPDAAAFTATGAGCIGTSLASGKTCSITVNFTPTQARAYSATLNVAGDSTSIPSSVANQITGSGK
jgi:hypothetical protein